MIIQFYITLELLKLGITCFSGKGPTLIPSKNKNWKF
jgi:hypothetical protein